MQGLVWKIFTFFFNYKFWDTFSIFLVLKVTFFISPKIWIYCILGLESSCFIFSLAYPFLYTFSIRLILETDSLDIKKICQISNIVYVQNYVNKYYTGNNIFMLHLLSFWLRLFCFSFFLATLLWVDESLYFLYLYFGLLLFEFPITSPLSPTYSFCLIIFWVNTWSLWKWEFNYI